MKYSDKILYILKEIDRGGLPVAVAVAEDYGVEIPVKPLGDGLWLVEDTHPVKPGYVYPSMLSQYFYCARRMWIQHRNGNIVDDEGLKLLIRGKVAEAMWRREHPEFEEEVEVAGIVGDVLVHGYADAVKRDGNNIIVVELKTAHRPSLGHKLQLEIYRRLVARLYGYKKTVGYLVYRHGVVKIESMRDALLLRYLKRAQKAVFSEIPPPPLPDRKYCDRCPYREMCAKLPVLTWDNWLVSIGDYPKNDKCARCPYLYICRQFRATHGTYPCESPQKVLAEASP